jgi:hypothetical protein
VVATPAAGRRGAAVDAAAVSPVVTPAPGRHDAAVDAAAVSPVVMPAAGRRAPASKVAFSLSHSFAPESMFRVSYYCYFHLIILCLL